AAPTASVVDGASSEFPVGAAPRGRPGGGPAPALTNAVGAAPRGRPLSLGDVVHRFKSLTTRRYLEGVRQRNYPPVRGRLWQRNYYERILRDARGLEAARRYILENPLRWAFDPENPERQLESPP
ncbi:MAG: transposase, partial [Thermoanaerobaculia bacterium]|nr:transposase [Thermoanaerobaculia bacterium]